ncbi:4-alpha-glucanotransferase [uncultured Sunxiuqinia sp.]|uniref:4-alpha-glucanotransferase n=1 Tax=uncultured Sunxiuqinia sp. TaxID=1573825 RepID=UPI00262B5AEF|nr:4-alpha-glucanotransferase [uncultured Sunxiuqinia sp.]
MSRSSGILVHISSLPGKYGIGSMGADAFAFVDFLKETGQKWWQILPLGPTGYGNSPYQSYSVFAGSELLISLGKLVEEELLSESDLADLTRLPSEKVDYDRLAPHKRRLLKKAYECFEGQFDYFKEAYYQFLGEHSWWLDDYALFQALKEQNTELLWNEWKLPYKKRDVHALDKAHLTYVESINFHRFVQFIFFKQWFELKDYANESGIQLFGDLPLYVALDSSDVWANQDLFLLDEEGRPTHVGGVPPDYFSETGQLWGCPVFDWSRLAERNYDWWMARMHFCLKMFDRVRIDHFRGLESFWSVPAGETTAIHGEWCPAKGYEMLKLLKSQIGDFPVVAEDLGVITQEVEALRDEFKLPGMKVLQFGFASDAANEHLPHNYGRNFVVYTGTHDNDTTLGWLNSATSVERRNIRRYFKRGRRRALDAILEATWGSVAELAMMPMQDLLQLDTKGRMNVPGVAAGNWEWRFEWKQIRPARRRFLKQITEKYNRC